VKTNQLMLDSIKKLLGDANVTLESVPWEDHSLNVHVQSPPAGDPILPGTKVKLTVPYNPGAVPARRTEESASDAGMDSVAPSGSGLGAAPNVIGLRWDSAVSVLRSVKLRAARQNQPDSAAAKWGVVQAQKFTAASKSGQRGVVTCTVAVEPGRSSGFVGVVLIFAVVIAALVLAAFAFRRINVARKKKKHMSTTLYSPATNTEWARSIAGREAAAPETPRKADGGSRDEPVGLTESDLRILRRVSRDYDDDRNYWIKEMVQLRTNLTFAVERIATLEARLDAIKGSSGGGSGGSGPDRGGGTGSLGARAHVVQQTRQETRVSTPVEAYNAVVKGGSRLAFQSTYEPIRVGMQSRSGDASLEEVGVTTRLVADNTGVFWLVTQGSAALLFPDPHSDQYSLIDIEQCFDIERVPRGAVTGLLIESIEAPARCRSMDGGKSWTVETKGRLRIYAKS